MAVKKSTAPPIHPAADAFPMMTDEELADLAEDIKANGLIHPIITDTDGVLLDGRNRLKACYLAGVEPRFEKFAGDSLAYIVSANLARRNLTKGQQAMAMAMIYPEGQKGKKVVENLNNFSRARLSQARTVLHHSRALAESVLKGTATLDETLATIKAVQLAERCYERLFAWLGDKEYSEEELLRETELRHNQLATQMAHSPTALAQYMELEEEIRALRFLTERIRKVRRAS
jgi:ParB/Sulfiredoxin domain